ncbi:hypothetical protein T492DRAFT_1015621 [Pavlovales sp. CCMP2436]|nr:hypothetical protein T492DRAFT_1015621 [Pavlovales sp. CCMP2436]
MTIIIMIAIISLINQNKNDTRNDDKISASNYCYHCSCCCCCCHHHHHCCYFYYHCHCSSYKFMIAVVPLLLSSSFILYVKVICLHVEVRTARAYSSNQFMIVLLHYSFLALLLSSSYLLMPFAKSKGLFFFIFKGLFFFIFKWAFYSLSSRAFSSLSSRGSRGAAAFFFFLRLLLLIFIHVDVRPRRAF